MFSDLMPCSALFKGKPLALYRAHCRELIQRQGAEISEPTSAEICSILSAISLKAPLKPHAAWYYWMHFDRIFPGKVDEPHASDDMKHGEAFNDLKIDVSRAIKKIHGRTA